MIKDAPKMKFADQATLQMTTTEIQNLAGNALLIHSSNKNTHVIHNKQTSVEQKTNTARSQNSLLHWKTLLVTASHNFEYIATELLPGKKNIENTSIPHNLKHNT